MKNKRKTISSTMPRQRKGFSIGEVLISSFLLLVGITAATALIVQDMREAFDARDTIIATQLAQEGVELVRNVRDTNIARRVYCDRFDDSVCSDSEHRPFYQFKTNKKENYWIDSQISAGAYDLHQGSPIYKLYIDSTTKEFTHDNGGGSNESTRFQRRLVLNPTGLVNNDTDFSNNEVIVHSFVTWDGQTPPTDVGQCTVTKKCSFAKDTLTGWLML